MKFRIFRFGNMARWLSIFTLNSCLIALNLSQPKTLSANGLGLRNHGRKRA